MSLDENDTGLGFGVRGTSPSDTGVVGVSGTRAGHIAPFPPPAPIKAGLEGQGFAGAYGVFAESDSGVGVYASTGGGDAVEGILIGATGQGAGVYGETHRPDGAGVGGIAYGKSSYGVAGFAHGDKGFGVLGRSYGDQGTSVIGYTTQDRGTGVLGQAAGPGGIGVYGRSSGDGGVAGYFDGILAAKDKQFLIDHPLDPANKYLAHACVESAERLNIYTGTAILDAKGEAWVELPKWFEVLNTDLRYQLTAIGSPAPNLYVAHKFHKGRFQIAGGKVGLEISWQVTGVRHDAYARAKPLQVEQDKSLSERGKYLAPAENGFPETMGIHYERAYRLQESMDVESGQGRIKPGG